MPVTAPPRNAACERRRDAAARGLGDAGVGAHRDVHADEAGRAGQHAADEEADGDLDVLQEDQDDEQHDARCRRSPCTGGSGRRARPPGRRRRSRCIRSLPGESASSWREVDRAVDDGEARADERDDDAVVAQEVLKGNSSAVSFGARRAAGAACQEPGGRALARGRPGSEQRASDRGYRPESRAVTGPGPRAARSAAACCGSCAGCSAPAGVARRARLAACHWA